MYLQIFSKRHKDRLKSGHLSISLSSGTKQRILYVLEQFDDSYYETTETGWNYSRSFTQDLEADLLREHGWEHLMAYLKDKQGMQKVGVQDFIRSGAPHYIFDAIELFSHIIGDTRYDFQAAINKIFRDSRLPWLVSDGVILQVDSECMADVLACASRLFKAAGFEGANQEFQEARSYFDSGDFKGAIHHANLALESTMKAVLGIEKEKPGRLIRKMIDSGIIPSYYDEFLENFEQMLRTVNIARNEEKGAGHGQGAEVAQIPSHLAELVLNFCGSLVVFLVNHHIDATPKPEPEPVQEPKYSIPDDDIPF
jgi:HEPN domain-containing protein